MQTRVVGVSVPRKEGAAKLTGQARYIDDLSLPGMIFGATVRSTIARGAIEEIKFGEGIRWHEFTIVTAKDIPGRNVVSLIVDDQPCLADGMVNHPEEPIVLLAHPDRHALAPAVAAVQIIYKPASAVHSIEESERRDPVIWGKDNIFKSYLMEKGDVDQAWAKAAWIVEGEYTTGAQEQLYIEPNGVIAQAGDTGGLTVWGSMQCPFYVLKALVALTGLAPENIRVIQAETGGAFGGKEEYPSMLAAHSVPAGDEGQATGQDHLRPHGRYGGHHQAPTLRAPGTVRRSPQTESCWQQKLNLSSMAAHTRPCPRLSSRAARSTQGDPITGPIFACTPGHMPPTHRRMALSVALAHRKVCLRSSAIWIPLPKPLAWRPTNFAAAICSARA